MFFNCEYSKLEKYKITFFSNLENLQLKKIVFYSNHIPKFEIYEITYLSNLWKKSIKKNHFLFSKILPLYPIPVPEGGGGIGHSGDFSCAAHLLIDLRSPNLVTFPDVVLLILRLFM